MRNFIHFMAVFFCAVFILAVTFSCNSGEAFSVELEMDRVHKGSSQCVNEKLFCVEEDIDALELTVTVEAEGGGGEFTIEDRDTGKIYWYIDFDEDAADTEKNVLLCALKKESEYVMRLTGENFDYLKAAITSRDQRIREQAPSAGKGGGAQI